MKFIVFFVITLIFFSIHADEEVKKLFEKIDAAIGSIHFDRDELNKSALGTFYQQDQCDGHGYKAENLYHLKRVVEVLNVAFNRTIAEVPEFIGISSAGVKFFLKQHGYDVDLAWNQFIAPCGAELRERFYEEKRFNQDFIEGLKNIETDIKKIFDNVANSLGEHGEFFNFNKEFDAVEINQTLRVIEKKKNSLVIRSSGREDTDDIANAGGNESISNVAIKASDILRAMGMSIGSYFSEKSFMQRLDGGDKALWDPPFIPVLIQRMIGERVQGLRSNHVKAFLKKILTGVEFSPKKSREKIVQAIMTPHFRFNEAFSAHDALIDEMIEQAEQEGWRMEIVSFDGRHRYKASNKASLAKALASILVKQIVHALGDIDQADCALVLRPVIKGKFLDREIPVCGVMFTEEPEGGIAKKDLLQDSWDFNKKARSTGITLIQASYGHNEGVVNSLIGIDSYFVADFDSMYSVVRQKPFRKIPSMKKNYILENRHNPKVLVNAPALSKKDLVDLKILAVALENYYRKPMDVEFVIDRAQGIIYLVQARPLTYNKKKIEPTYFRDLSAVDSLQYKGSAIVSAGGAVRFIDRFQQLIVKTSLGDAFFTYLRHENKNFVECVAIEEHASATSHEAAHFRTAAKPVIFVPQFNEIEKALEQRLSFAVDVQREMIIAYKENSEVFNNKKFLAQGWRNYPIPREISLNKDIISEKLIDEKYESFLKKELEAYGVDEAYFREKKSYHEHLEGLRDDDEQKSRAALISLLIFVRNMFDALFSMNKFDEELVSEVRILKGYILDVACKISGLLSVTSDQDEYMRRLYYLRFLEALIYQHPWHQDVISVSSVAQLSTKVARSEKIVIDKLKAIGVPDLEYLIQKSDLEIQVLKDSGNADEALRIELAKKQIQLARAHEIALTEETAQKWLQVVAGLGTVGLTEKQQQDFLSLVIDLFKFNMFPIWLHTTFIDKFSQNDLNKTFVQLIRRYNKSKKVLADLNQEIDMINQLRPDLFSDPKTLSAQMDLLREIVGYFTSETFADKFYKTDNFGKMAILCMTESFVSVFDRSIKAAKIHEDISLFKDMLEHYFKLLEVVSAWKYRANKDASTQMPSCKDSVYSLISLSPLAKIARVRDALLAINIDNPGEVIGTPSFDVNAAKIGSQAKFRGPVTLEDIFTFTHQSLIDVISWLMQKIKLARFVREKSNRLPQLAKDILNELYSISSKGSDCKKIAKTKVVSLVGAHFNTDGFSFKFNYSLRSHSALVTIDYINHKVPFVKMNCTVAGINEWGRFYKIAAYAKIVALFLNLQSDIKLTRGSVTFSWNMTQDDFNKIKNEYPSYIIGQLLEMATDGPSCNGFSYATGNLLRVLFIEEFIFNFLAETLCKNQIFLKNRLAEIVIDQSLERNSVNIFIHRILPFIENQSERGDELWENVFQIMERLFNPGLYAIKSDLNFFRSYRTPSFGGLFCDLGEEYFNVSEENIIEKLEKHESIGDKAAASQAVSVVLGTGSFKQGFARLMVNVIAQLFPSLSQKTKIICANFMKNYALFFAEIEKGVWGKVPQNKILPLLKNEFFSTDPVGIEAILRINLEGSKFDIQQTQKKIPPHLRKLQQKK